MTNRRDLVEHCGSGSPGNDEVRRAIRKLWRASIPGEASGQMLPTHLSVPRGDATETATARWVSTGNGQLASIGASLRSGETTAAELAQSALDQASKTNLRLGAFVTRTPDLTLRMADKADRALRLGRDYGPLHGIPIAVKDVIDVQGVWTRNGTSGLGHHLAKEDSDVWARLAASGAVFVGKTRTHELAWGVVTPGCSNPVDLSRSPGGSSGGSAVAVAAGIVPVAIGTDTGGSVRIPAAMCGVIGLKPTYGSVPMGGVSSLAPSQDTVGPLTRRVIDALVVHGVLAGLPMTPLQEPIHGRLGIFSQAWAHRNDEEVERAAAAALTTFSDCGFTLVEVTPPLADFAPASSFIVMLVEAAHSWHQALTGAEPCELGADVEALLRLGETISGADYLQAVRVGRLVRTNLTAEFSKQKLDALLLPTCPTVAFPLDANTIDVLGRSEPVPSAVTRLTALASSAGLPALSVPCGLTTAGLPVGIQLIGVAGSEGMLCSYARILEDVADRRDALVAAGLNSE